MIASVRPPSWRFPRFGPRSRGLHRAVYRTRKKAPSQTVESRPTEVKQFRSLLRLLKWQRPDTQRAKHAGDGRLPLSIVLWFGHRRCPRGGLPPTLVRSLVR